MGSIFVDDIYFTDFLQLACRNDDDDKVENIIIAISRRKQTERNGDWRSIFLYLSLTPIKILPDHIFFAF